MTPEQLDREIRWLTVALVAAVILLAVAWAWIF